MKNISIRTWLCSMALVCFASTVFAQTKPTTTATTTKTKTTTTTPTKSTAGMTTTQTVNPKTQAEVERMLKEGKSKEEIIEALQGKYSSKDLVASLRTPKTPVVGTGSGQPSAPVFTEDDKNDAVEMVMIMPLNRGYLSAEQMNAIVQVYGVPNFDVWLEILTAAELVSRNNIYYWMDQFSIWLLSPGAPQWQSQFIPAACKSYHNVGSSPGAVYTGFYIGGSGRPLERGSAASLISGTEKRNLVYSTLLSEFDITEQALFRSTIDAFDGRYLDERILMCMTRLEEIRGVKNAVYWAQVFRMENVNNDHGGVCEPIPMDKALRVLTSKYGTVVATQAVRDVYQ